MKKYSQWALILVLALAITVLLAPGGVANGNNDDDDNGEGNDDCPGNSCHDNDDGDDDECGCPGVTTEFLAGNFHCNGGATLTFSGSSGVGDFMISQPVPPADPNGPSDPNAPLPPTPCAELAGLLEDIATDEDCTSAGVVTAPSVMLSFTCVGDRDDIVETMGSLVTQVVTFAPSTPLIFQNPATSISLTPRAVGRRR